MNESPTEKRFLCVICLEEYEKDTPDITWTPCFHGYHRACIKTWIKQHLDSNSIPCPMCMHNIRDLLPAFPEFASSPQGCYTVRIVNIEEPLDPRLHHPEGLSIGLNELVRTYNDNLNPDEFTLVSFEVQRGITFSSPVNFDEDLANLADMLQHSLLLSDEHSAELNQMREMSELDDMLAHADDPYVPTSESDLED